MVASWKSASTGRQSLRSGRQYSAAFCLGTVHAGTFQINSAVLDV
jgi:hypothetical protein